MLSSHLIPLTVVGIVSGLAAGIVGAGTEIMIVPMLTLFGLYANLKQRIGTSLVMLLPPIGLMAAYRYYQKGYADIPSGLYMAAWFALAAYVSSTYVIDIDEQKIRVFFSIFIICIGLYMLFSKPLKKV